MKFFVTTATFTLMMRTTIMLVTLCLPPPANSESPSPALSTMVQPSYAAEATPTLSARSTPSGILIRLAISVSLLEAMKTASQGVESVPTTVSAMTAPSAKAPSSAPQGDVTAPTTMKTMTVPRPLPQPTNTNGMPPNVDCDIVPGHHFDDGGCTIGWDHPMSRHCLVDAQALTLMSNIDRNPCDLEIAALTADEKFTWATVVLDQAICYMDTQAFYHAHPPRKSKRHDHPLIDMTAPSCVDLVRSMNYDERNAWFTGHMSSMGCPGRGYDNWFFPSHQQKLCHKVEKDLRGIAEITD